jgi:hypothetical protein
MSHHIPYLKRNVGVESSCVLYHAKRKIQAKYARASVPQESRDVAYTTAHVTNVPTALHVHRETIEQFSVQRLGLQFVEASMRICTREVVIGFSN